MRCAFVAAFLGGKCHSYVVRPLVVSPTASAKLSGATFGCFSGGKCYGHVVRVFGCLPDSKYCSYAVRMWAASPAASVAISSAVLAVFPTASVTMVWRDFGLRLVCLVHALRPADSWWVVLLFDRTYHGAVGENVVCDGGSANSSSHSMQKGFVFYSWSRVACAGVGPLAALPGDRDGWRQRLRAVAP